MIQKKSKESEEEGRARSTEYKNWSERRASMAGRRKVVMQEIKKKAETTTIVDTIEAGMVLDPVRNAVLSRPASISKTACPDQER